MHETPALVQALLEAAYREYRSRRPGAKSLALPWDLLDDYKKATWAAYFAGMFFAWSEVTMRSPTKSLYAGIACPEFDGRITVFGETFAIERNQLAWRFGVHFYWCTRGVAMANLGPLSVLIEFPVYRQPKELAGDGILGPGMGRVLQFDQCAMGEPGYLAPDFDREAMEASAWFAFLFKGGFPPTGYPDDYHTAQPGG